MRDIAAQLNNIKVSISWISTNKIVTTSTTEVNYATCYETAL